MPEPHRALEHLVDREPLRERVLDELVTVVSQEALDPKFEHCDDEDPADIHPRVWFALLGSLSPDDEAGEVC